MDGFLGLLSERFQHLFSRASGPLNFRLVVMPTVVTILAIKAYLKDAREGHPLFLGAFITSPTERRRLLRSGLKDFGRIFIVACVLDTIYQFVALKGFYPGEMVIVAIVCAVVPYFLVRGPITRIVHLVLHRRDGAADAQSTAMEPSAEGREKQE
jgi:hypothetical protein